MSIWIVTPTYNERQSLQPLLARLRATVPQATILVVDDNSPDGTGQLADQLAAHDQAIRVIHRPGKAGLGVAYAAGLDYALQAGAEFVVHLDADGSHPVEDIPAMLNALQDADLVLASRYVPGGSMPIDPFRRLISSLGNTYIRLLLGPGVHDWSTGFKAWRATMLRRVLDQHPTTTGYAWLMETTWLARQQGARIVERPLVFRARTEGESKFSLAIAMEDLRLAWRLRR